MNCTKCGNPTRVLDTRKGEHGMVKRRRECTRGHEFWTFEMAQAAVNKDRLRKAAAATAKRVKLYARDIEIAKSLHKGADVLADKFGISTSAVYMAATNGRKYAREHN